LSCDTTRRSLREVTCILRPATSSTLGALWVLRRAFCLP